MSYAIVWRENGDPVRAGKLVVHFDRLVLEGGTETGASVRHELDYGGIGSIRIGRGRDERLGGRPVAVLETDAKTFTIASLVGRGELNEVVELVNGALASAAPPLV